MDLYYIFGILLVGAWAIYILRDKPLEEKVKNEDMRKRIQQSKNISSLSLLRSRLGAITDEKVSYHKRASKETVYLQAGFKFRYADHILLGIGGSIFFSGVFAIILKNPFIIPAFLIMGYHVPFMIVQAIRNRRIGVIDKQVGTFLKMILKRYEVTDDFGKAFRYVASELQHEEPINLDLESCVRMIDLGVPMTEVLDHFALRTSNKFVVRLSEYYRIVSDIGTAEARENLLQQAYIQYEEQRQIQRLLKEKLSEPVRECYMVLGMVPSMALYQAFSTDGYIQFMTGTTAGRIGTTVVLTVCLMAFWFINTKIGAPID